MRKFEIKIHFTSVYLTFTFAISYGLVIIILCLFTGISVIRLNQDVTLNNKIV
jgi:hypothetical protein